MVTVNFTQLRQNARDYFDKVERGETVRVMRHGKVIAEIKPPRTDKLKLNNDFEPLIIEGVSLSEEIIKERERDL